MNLLWMTGDSSWGFVRCCPGPFQPPGGAQRKPTASPDGFDFSCALTSWCVSPGRVDTMACPPQTELSFAWEKYMDCRLQGADLQVGTCWGGRALAFHLPMSSSGGAIHDTSMIWKVLRFYGFMVCLFCFFRGAGFNMSDWNECFKLQSWLHLFVMAD